MLAVYQTKFHRIVIYKPICEGFACSTFIQKEGQNILKYSIAIFLINWCYSYRISLASFFYSLSYRTIYQGKNDLSLVRSDLFISQNIIPLRVRYSKISFHFISFWVSILVPKKTSWAFGLMLLHTEYIQQEQQDWN